MPTASESPITVTRPGSRAAGVAGCGLGRGRAARRSAFGFGRGVRLGVVSVGVGTGSVPSTTLSSGLVAGAPLGVRPAAGQRHEPGCRHGHRPAPHSTPSRRMARITSVAAIDAPAVFRCTPSSWRTCTFRRAEPDRGGIPPAGGEHRLGVHDPHRVGVAARRAPDRRVHRAVDGLEVAPARAPAASASTPCRRRRASTSASCRAPAARSRAPSRRPQHWDRPMGKPSLAPRNTTLASGRMPPRLAARLVVPVQHRGLGDPGADVRLLAHADPAAAAGAAAGSCPGSGSSSRRWPGSAGRRRGGARSPRGGRAVRPRVATVTGQRPGAPVLKRTAPRARPLRQAQPRQSRRDRGGRAHTCSVTSPEPKRSSTRTESGRPARGRDGFRITLNRLRHEGVRTRTGADSLPLARDLATSSRWGRSQRQVSARRADTEPVGDCGDRLEGAARRTRRPGAARPRGRRR